MSGNAIYLATIWAIPVIIAITFHEAAHGFVAHLLGDDTGNDQRPKGMPLSAAA
jgi:Zn-dependent protease